MAQIAFSTAGASLGSALLPSGIGALGFQVSGAVIGQAIGGIAGRALDNALFGQNQEGPRIASIPIMESREGAGIPNVYGRMRLGGQLIWTGGLTEMAESSRVGAKGGPRITEFSYSASFAIALCEGEIARVERVWANGEELSLGQLTHRLYKGDQHQLPDPLIEAIEGAACAPAYRGTAYIVFEDLPLDVFGNRLPQLSFEVVRIPPRVGDEAVLGDVVTGVNIIPASGEFVYGTEIVSQRTFPAIERPQNMNNGDGRADFLVSLDQMQADLPRVRDVALTVGWFGDDLRAGSCQVRPGVETRDRITRPYSWGVSGQSRSQAYLISRDATGAPNYGGTPADRAVIEGLRDLSQRGFAVTITPFLFMDIPPGNGRADPYGGAEQAAFPWRGRITAPDGNAETRADIEAFLGNAAANDFRVDGLQVGYVGSSDDTGYRRFILHHAWLAKVAGGVEAFLIGSEMRGLTRLRDGEGRFPFIEGLIALANDVRSILGSDVKVSYAADWTEYGAYVPSDGSGDVLFPMDALWAHPNIDFVGIDWYPPLGDWRDGTDHLDAVAGYLAADDPAYLRDQITAGEAYDFFYASDAARVSQIRTPIVDTAHGEDWVFRQKDLQNWWQNSHFERPGGVRASRPTAWSAGTKPVRLSEIGFAAVDKGGNAPNVFFDPGSSESALPPFSTGARDDVFQRRALEATLSHWDASPIVEAAYVWTWDARPWPDFPLRDTVWSDGANWTVGHWLNGRAGLSLASDVIADIGRRGGVTLAVSDVGGILEGFALTGISSLRRALEPLVAAFDLDVVEREGQITFGQSAGPTQQQVLIGEGQIAGDGLIQSRSLLDKVPGRLRLSYISTDTAYQPALVEARNTAGDRGVSVDVSLPLLLNTPRAEAIGQRLLAEFSDGHSGQLNMGLAGLALEPGDLVHLEAGESDWQVADITDGPQRGLSLRPVLDRLGEVRAGTAPALRALAVTPSAPEVVVVDGPPLPDALEDGRPLVGAAGRPWPGRVDVRVGLDGANQNVRASLARGCGFGRLEQALSTGPLGRWDEANTLAIRMPGELFAATSQRGALGRETALLVGDATGWELISYRDAELLGPDVYRLSGLLRGLQGTEIRPLMEGALAVRLDTRLVRGRWDTSEIGVLFDLTSDAGGLLNAAGTYAHAARALLPWAPGHLQIEGGEGNQQIRWVRRSRHISDSWDLPEAANEGRFQVSLLNAGVLVEQGETDRPEYVTQVPFDHVQVREIGPDGRLGAPGEIAI